MLKRYRGTAVGLAVLSLSAGWAKPAAAGPTALDILKKTQAVITSSKTYQATILVTNTVGSSGSFTMRVNMKTAGNKGSFNTSAVGHPTGKFAMAAVMGNSQVVDDGKTMTIYSPTSKTYVKRPSRGGVSPAASFRDISGIAKNANLTLAPPETIAGKPVFVIIATPKNAPKSRSKTTIYIDQATYHPRQMKVESMSPGPNGQQPEASTIVVQIQDEKYNEPIPDSVFRFTPPPGSKEMQGGFTGMGPRTGPGPGSRR